MSDAHARQRIGELEDERGWSRKGAETTEAQHAVRNESTSRSIAAKDVTTFG